MIFFDFTRAPHAFWVRLFKLSWICMCAYISVHVLQSLFVHKVTSKWSVMKTLCKAKQTAAVLHQLSVQRIPLASFRYIGIWPVSLHPDAELCFSANVSLCLCNWEKFVFAESKLTALQNSLHLNTHYCPWFIFLHRPQFSPHLCPNMQSWLGKLSTDCRYSWCFAAFPEIICLSPAVLRVLLLPFLQH